jgi:hypothetical protein
MNADAMKKWSLGWSGQMDSQSIVVRLAAIDELYASWKSLSHS